MGKFIAWLLVDLLILIALWWLLNYGSNGNFHFPDWNFWGVTALILAYRTSGILQNKKG